MNSVGSVCTKKKDDRKNHLLIQQRRCLLAISVLGQVECLCCITYRYYAASNVR